MDYITGHCILLSKGEEEKGQHFIYIVYPKIIASFCIFMQNIQFSLGLGAG